MRPPLDERMGEIPISARIALQLTAIEYRKRIDESVTASTCAYAAGRNLPDLPNGMLRLALSSLGTYLALGWTSKAWLEEVFVSAHYGHCFRRCFFFEYKANRRPYPRVTNRGVQTTGKRPTSDKRKAKLLEPS